MTSPAVLHQPRVKVEAKEESVAEPRVFTDIIRTVILENAVVVLGRRGCCMCHVIRTLLNCNGANPVVFEVDEGDEVGVSKALAGGGYWDGGGKKGEGEGEGVLLQLPVVFVGGKGFGGLEEVMSFHIKGELVPILKEVGALWL
ncbi:hypothetical protein MLD38_021166 [Melastoma candidum]|uniref:Uncharacterized protein n=1 Tax=Melastoma candidum TaxID=119954 RepID=A0ACB9QI50_9MYRT|nr:hypothetical protein MLD38_021166 [Melastoma candidum]